MPANAAMKWLLLFILAAMVWGAADAGCPACGCDVSVAPIIFGSYNPVDPASTRVTSPLHLSCDSDGSHQQQSISFSIGLSSGKGSYDERQMIQGPWRLAYNLYADSARTAVWGNGAGDSTEMGGTLAIGPFGGQKNFTIYGNIPAMQNVPAGPYFDIIVTTVTY
jgi:spore coat protein U-like protein